MRSTFFLVTALAILLTGCKASAPPPLPTDLAAVSNKLKFESDMSDKRQTVYEVTSTFDEVLSELSSTLPGKGWESTNVHTSKAGIRTIIFIRPDNGEILLMDNHGEIWGGPRVELTYISHPSYRVDPKTKLLVRTSPSWND